MPRDTKAKGKQLGRPEVTLPEGFDSVYMKWKGR